MKIMTGYVVVTKEIHYFVFSCLLFGAEDPWAKFGMKVINHLAEKIRNHQASSVHIKNPFQFSLFGMYSIAVGQ